MNVVAFSKKMSFDDELMESPLPGDLKSLYDSGTDVRLVSDPLLASHYLTLIDLNDFNLRIALLRALPVVSESWLVAIREEPQKVEDWLLDIKDEYFYSKSNNNFVFPDTNRRSLLSGINCFICHGAVSKQVGRLQEWIRCLGCEPTLLDVDDQENVEATLRDATAPFVFHVENDEKVNFLIERLNNIDALWNAVVNNSLSHLRPFAPNVKRESQVSDLRLSQRKKRRKLEKVGDTDFFLFSQKQSTPASEPEVLDHVDFNPAPSARHSQLVNEEHANSKMEENSTSEPPRTTVPSEPHEEVQIDDKDTESATQSIEASEELNKRPLDSVIEQEAKRHKAEPAKLREKIIPRVSLVDAVLSTKKQADDVIKKELGIDDFDENVNEKLDKLVIVEEVDLLVRKKKDGVEARPDYKGRKNFKKFKKAGTVPKNITRTFIPLEDHDNSIHFEDYAPRKNTEGKGRLASEFEREMKEVKGYQPQESQLFVGEESDDGADMSFSFLTTSREPTTLALTPDDDSDDDGDVAFAFTRK